MPRLIIQGATVLTMNPASEVLDRADILIEDGQIIAIGPDAALPWRAPGAPPHDLIDASGLVALPGFVQTHIHLCQTLFRHLADDLALIDWLKLRIWPLEAAHSFDSLTASANLGVAELLRSGTTTLLDMGTVHHTDAIGIALERAGIRAIFGKVMMDHGPDVPPGLLESTRDALAESEALCKRWHNHPSGLLQYAFCPRFAHSCSTALLEGTAHLCAQHGATLHTHSSETQFEVNETLRLYGSRNIPYLHRCGLTGPRSVFAHGVWLDDAEISLLARTSTAIAHCPSSNLKLASGIAPIPKLLAAGVKVGLGADGAPCNNTLDAFTEMRLAALIQKPLLGPTAMPADLVLRLATIDGARALGLDHLIGSLEPGKRADITLLSLHHPHNGTHGALASRIVYGSYPHNVHSVLVDGKPLLRSYTLTTLDEPQTLAYASEQTSALLQRANL
jgi:cytosine/adenosine deaminase-related metal-dependent hydrolase